MYRIKVAYDAFELCTLDHFPLRYYLIFIMQYFLTSVQFVIHFLLFINIKERLKVHFSTFFIAGAAVKTRTFAFIGAHVGCNWAVNS
jgi:hypothetical protein